ncbi:hypothetical protein [Clostridium gasigenes]|nr:hypothetical protein [Clostridium gasigenes]MBB6623847.1 hypothetical protein [Clostridium gasigenes]MBU3131611.1 hypothetical protein [Clostridium gasigenes]
MKVISSITSLEFKDFKVNIDTKKTKLDEEKKYNETNNNIYNVPEHVLKDQKQEIESLIIDMPFMASIIDSYLNRGLLNIKLNLNLIPYKITLSNLSKIFEYKLRANSVEIIKMRNDIEPIVVDCFKSLLEKGIIYIEN